MKKIWIGKALFLLCIPCVLYGTDRPDFDDLSSLKDVTFFLTTRKSGSNWVSTGLSLLTRRPIAWLDHGNAIFNPDSKWRNHPSYNRLKLPLISEEPLLYRTHFRWTQLMKVPSNQNKLIFVTRNPKELLFREFFLTSPCCESPDPSFIEAFLNQYLKAFHVYDSWTASTKKIVFYEDCIQRNDEILIDLLQFMGQEPNYLSDYIENKQIYRDRLLESYQEQHKGNFGGISSRQGPQEIYYSKNAYPHTLTYIDEYIKKVNPTIWEHYLKRFGEAASL
jgi:hypothetical protein